MILCLQEEPLVVPVDETAAFVACAVCVSMGYLWKYAGVLT